MTTENKLKEIIKEKYGSVSEFARQINLNESTVRTVLSVSGIHKTSVNVLFKITRALYLDAERLYLGEIKYLDELKNDIVYKSNKFINELRGGEYTLNGEKLTRSEIEDIVSTIKFSIEQINRRREEETK